MAMFTVEFGEAVELTGGRVEFANENDTGHSRIIGGAVDLNRYPLFDEDYRARLNGLIIDRFYNREIGHETVSMFTLKLRSHLNEHMPYFNKLYRLELIDVDPLSTINMQTLTSSTAEQQMQSTQQASAEGHNETESSTGSKTRSVFSDLPQTMLAGNEDYATNATDANGGATANAQTDETTSTETDTTSEGTNTTDGDSHTYGYQGHAAELLAVAREAVANIDVMVLDSMEVLFMGIWSSGDTATPRQGFYYGF